MNPALVEQTLESLQSVFVRWVNCIDESTVSDSPDLFALITETQRTIARASHSIHELRRTLDAVKAFDGTIALPKQLTPEQAQVLSDALATHHQSPVMPVTRYCAAIREWAELAVQKGIIDRTAYQSIQGGIGKSCLLSRTIYGGEKLRTRRCPIHMGIWSGIAFDDICPAGCNTGSCGCTCGWIPNEYQCNPNLGWTFWLAVALGVVNSS